MRIIITLIFGLIASMLKAQNVPIDFEQGGFGATWTWTVFENDDNPPLEIVANPDPTGINTSSTVAKFTALQGGQPWAGFESMHGSDIGSFSFDSTNCIIKIMVWKSVISDVGIKFVDAGNAAQPEKKVSNTLTEQWEELTFDFTDRIGVFPIVKDQIVIFPDFDLNGRTKDNVVYIDNVYGSPNTASLPNDVLSNIRLYPNPTTDFVYIENIEGPMELEVFNVLGNLKERSTNKSIDISHYTKGIYFFKINFNRNSQVFKIVKED